MPLLDLGRDIFEHHLLPYLSIYDALQLRQTCHEVRDFLDQPIPLWNALIRQELKIASPSIKDPLRYAVGYSQIQAVHVPYWTTWMIRSQSTTTPGFADFEQELKSYEEPVQIPRHVSDKQDRLPSELADWFDFGPSWPFGDQPVKDVTVNRAVMASLTPAGNIILVPRDGQPRHGKVLKEILKADPGRRFDRMAATALLLAAVDDAGKLYVWHCDRMKLEPLASPAPSPVMGMQFIPQSWRLMYHDRRTVSIVQLCEPYTSVELPSVGLEIEDFAICGMFCVVILMSNGSLYAQQFAQPMSLDGSSDDEPPWSEPLPIIQNNPPPVPMRFVKVISSPNEINELFWAITDKGQVVQGQLDPYAELFCPAQQLEIIPGLDEVVNITPWQRIDFHGFMAHTVNGKVYGVTRELKVTELQIPAISRIVDTFSGGVLLIFPIY